jgi:hypothetical protein
MATKWITNLYLESYFIAIPYYRENIKDIEDYSFPIQHYVILFH